MKNDSNSDYDVDGLVAIKPRKNAFTTQIAPLVFEY